MQRKRELSLFGKECKKRMIEIGISQKELGIRVGSTAKYLDLVFHGQRSGGKYVEKICEVLELDIDEIEKKIA